MENSKEQGKKKVSNEDLEKVNGGMREMLLRRHFKLMGKFRVQVVRHAGIYVGQYGTVIDLEDDRVLGLKTTLAIVQLDSGEIHKFYAHQIEFA